MNGARRYIVTVASPARRSWGGRHKRVALALFACYAAALTASNMQVHAQRNDFVFTLVCLLLFVSGVWGVRKAVVHYQHAAQEREDRRLIHSKDHFWMMDSLGPKGSVRLWLPEYMNHAGNCPPDKYSTALAYSTALYAIQNGHFHVVRDKEYGGFRIDEFVHDKHGTGEQGCTIPFTIMACGWMKMADGLFSQDSHLNSTILNEAFESEDLHPCFNPSNGGLTGIFAEIGGSPRW